MRIINKKPWFTFILKWFFPMADHPQVVIAFGDRVYASVPMSKDLILHESVHLKQMHYSRIFALYFWSRYIMSETFRYNAELEAYQMQYGYIKDNYQWKRTKDLLTKLSRELSGPIYGNIVSYEKAKKDIEQC